MSQTGRPVLFPLYHIWPKNMLIFNRETSCNNADLQILLKIFQILYNKPTLCLSRIVACRESRGSPICCILITHNDSYTLVPGQVSPSGYPPGRWVKAFVVTPPGQEEAKVGEKGSGGNKKHRAAPDTSQVKVWIYGHIYKWITASH